MPQATRRQEILNEAARQLNGRGLLDSLVADVSDGVGITRAAMYHYVDDRQDLVFQCYRASCEAMARHLAEAVREGSGVVQRLQAFIHRMLEGAEPETATITEIAYLSDEQRDTIRGLYRGIIAQLAVLIEQGIREKTLRPCDGRIVAHVIMGMISWVPLSVRWSAGIGDLERSRAVQAIKELVLEGVAQQPEAFALPPVFDLSEVALPTGVAFDRKLLNALRRETLVVNASRLFSRKGVAATSLDEIAAQVKTTKRAILYYFGDKPSLITACYRHTFRVVQFVIDEAMRLHENGLRALAAAWFTLGEATLRSDLSPLYPATGFDALPPDLRTEMSDNASRLDMTYRAVIARGREDGSIRAFDEIAVLFVGAGAFVWAAGDLIEEPLDMRHMASEIAKVLCQGIRLRTKRRRR